MKLNEYTILGVPTRPNTPICVYIYIYIYIYKFLQSTSGIKYWNFFIDSIRLLQSRYSSRYSRIDISYLNFIFKYYSRYHEFRTIAISHDHSLMPNSTTPDSIWFQMAINAIYQLRMYWLPRYLKQLSLSLQSERNHSKIKLNLNQIKNVDRTLSSETSIPTSMNYYLSNSNSKLKESQFIKFTVDNMSYIDYNPQQYIHIQSTEQDDFQQNIELFNDSNNTNDNHQIENSSKMNFPLSSSDRSIEEYATDANTELFYRILISDSLAGSPFFDYISQTINQADRIPLQTYIRFMIDAEILLSLPFGEFKQKILKQFISQ